jgi:hypothetical protein
VSVADPESLEALIEGSGQDSCELGCLFGRKGSRGTTGKSLGGLVMNDGANSEIGIEEYEDGRVNSNEVDIDGSGLVVEWYVPRGPACRPTVDDGVIVEGTTDGALYTLVEEKCWLAK